MPLTILLADDSMTAQKMGKEILVSAGYEVIAVSNGAAAAKKLADKPDIIILDVFMPGYTGLEICEKVRASMEISKTPVILTVLNNGILGYQKHAENAKFGAHTTACYFAPVDHAAIARACGCRGVRIENADAYPAALKEALAYEGTTVLDVITDPTAFPPVTLFDQLDGDGS